MQILNGTGSTSYNDVQIETGVTKLFFRLTIALFASLANVLCTVKVNSKRAGTKTIIPNLPLEDLLEIAASNEGFVNLSMSGSDIVVEGSVELSNLGAIDTREGYVSLSVAGMLADDQVEIWAVDSKELVKSYISYEQVYVNASSQKEILVDKAYSIALPVSCTSVEMVYNNGRTVTFDSEELKLITNEINELSFLDSTADLTGIGSDPVLGGGFVKPGSKKFFVLGLPEVVSCKVTLSSAANCYLIKNLELE